MLQTIPKQTDETLIGAKEKYPDKFASYETIFSNVRPGARIFVGTGCGEPQHLVAALVNYVESHPKAFFDAELLHLVTLGVLPYTDVKFQANFRYNAFFIAGNIRSGVNRGLADYTPINLSEAPGLIAGGRLPVDIALIQTSPPDAHGFMSLGVSVDITKTAVEKARLVIAQINRNMPRIHGDGFVNIADVDYAVICDEPVLEYSNPADPAIAERIGVHVSHLVHDGDVIQTGYGKLPGAILPYLRNKHHLGVHTELLSDGIVDLIKRGVVDNSAKTINRGKTIASFCMGTRGTYEYVHDNPTVELRSIDYTNNPLVIAQHANMTAINSALEIDLTGQATAESIGNVFYSGIGGQADFMRGALLARGGKTMLLMQSTAKNGEVSRVVPFLREGSGVTLNRADVHYVVTEYGVAYLHGKNIRERAMSLIAVAHPKFRPWLVEEARRLHLVYDDQAVIPGLGGEYPAQLETHRQTRAGLRLFIRPVKISDEPLLKDFFYSLSAKSMYRRFASNRMDVPHERLQEFTVIDNTREIELLAMLDSGDREDIVGVGWWYLDEGTRSAELAFAVRDDFQNKGIGSTLLAYLTELARKEGLVVFVAEVLSTNDKMLHLFAKAGFEVVSTEEGMHTMKYTFKEG